MDGPSSSPAPSWCAAIATLQKVCHLISHDSFDLRARAQYRLRGYTAEGELVWEGIVLYSRPELVEEARRVHALINRYHLCVLEPPFITSKEPFEGLNARITEDRLFASRHGSYERTRIRDRFRR